MLKPKKTMIEQPLDEPRRLVLERSRELGLELAPLSKQMGRNHAYLQQYVRYAVPRELGEDDRASLAALLGVDPIKLRVRKGDSRPPHTNVSSIMVNIPSDVSPATQVRLDSAKKRPEDVPVLGVVRGGSGDGFELNMGEPLEYVRRPLSLIGKGGVYALHIDGSSMAPRYEPGETILVYYSRPPLIGRDVVVQIKPTVDGDPPRAYLKRLVKRSDKEITLSQFNPPRTMTIKMADVVSIHMVLTRDEMV
jgi:SOS-response transcriptional repressor LexA